jgi:polyisoprenoid-binding protein YceI
LEIEIMRHATIALLITLLVLPLRGGASDNARFVPAKTPAKTTEVMIKGTSSLHDWTMGGTTINGSIETDPTAWRVAGDKLAKAVVSIPVASIKSEHKKMDALMQEALKAKTNPELRYEVTAASVPKVTSEGFIVRTTGKLTIAGMTRDVSMDVTATRVGDEQYALVGSVPVRMPDYGIKPPTAMLGTIKTGADVTVTFRWVVGKA